MANGWWGQTHLIRSFARSLNPVLFRRALLRRPSEFVFPPYLNSLMNTASAGNDCEAARASWRYATLVAVMLAALLCGCGTTKSFTATEQLLVSDAVDSTVAKIDFRPLTGKKVYLDNTFVPSQKGVPNPNPQLVHSEYVSSSLRQQMLAAGVYLCDKRDDAELIVEARLGALGFDGHSVTYGLPASNSLTTAASTLSGAPMIPLLPELSFAKKEAKQGAAKIALFAYERVSLQPVWQSGIARSSSSARDTWVLGMGPLQYGTIYEGGTRFAGNRIIKGPVSRLVHHEDDEPEELVDYKRSQVFNVFNQDSSDTATASNPPAGGAGVTSAGATAPAGTSAAATPASATGPAASQPPTPPPVASAAPPAATPPVAPPTAPVKGHLDDKPAK